LVLLFLYVIDEDPMLYEAVTPFGFCHLQAF